MAVEGHDPSVDRGSVISSDRTSRGGLACDACNGAEGNVATSLFRHNGPLVMRERAVPSSGSYQSRALIGRCEAPGRLLPISSARRDTKIKEKRKWKKKNSPPQRRPPSCFQNVPEHTRPASSLPSPPNSLPQNLTSHFFFSVLGRRDVSPSNEILDLGFSSVPPRRCRCCSRVAPF